LCQISQAVSAETRLSREQHWNFRFCEEEGFAAGRRIQCQVLALSGCQGFAGRGYDPLAVWQQCARTSAASRCPPAVSSLGKRRT
jgi:hypothetical protein